MWPRILAGGSFRRGGYARRPVGAEEPNYANFLAICPSRISFTVRAMMLVPERRVIGVAAPSPRAFLYRPEPLILMPVGSVPISNADRNSRLLNKRGQCSWKRSWLFSRTSWWE